MSDPPPFELGYPRTELRRRLVEAVLTGVKTATSRLADGEPPPDPGDRFTLHDFDDRPVAVVEVTEARIVRTADIDARFAHEEGEGFASVAAWRDAHAEFFGRPLRDDTPIVAIRFRVAERL